MKAKIIIPFSIIITIILAAAVYFWFCFFPNSVINGTSVSCLSVNAALEKIKNEDKTEIILVENGEEIQKIKIKEIADVKYDVNKINEVLKLYRYKTVNTAVVFEIKPKDNFKDTLNKINENRTEQSSSKVEFNEDEFEYEVIRGEIGNKIDIDKLAEDIINNKNKKAEFELSDYYYEYDFSKDEANENKAEFANKKYSGKIEYELFDDEVFVLDKKTFGNWFTDDGIDEECVEAFLTDFKEKTNTAYTKRTFKNKHGKIIELEPSEYGWIMDVKKEKEEIIDTILNKKQVKRRPYYSQEAAKYSKMNDIGDKYVEVDKDNQHLYFIDNGIVKLETDVVTGRYNTEYETKDGLHFVWIKQSNRYLTGPGYNCYVYRFMAFYRGQGFHDATWRNKFGGEVYKSNGSHGCVNMPKEKALDLYELVWVGCPVIVY